MHFLCKRLVGTANKNSPAVNFSAHLRWPGSYTAKKNQKRRWRNSEARKKKYSSREDNPYILQPIDGTDALGEDQGA